jgi:hypothetical protein
MDPGTDLDDVKRIGPPASSQSLYRMRSPSDGHSFFTINHSISPKLHYRLLNTCVPRREVGPEIPKSEVSGTMPGRGGHHTQASDIT